MKTLGNKINQMRKASGLTQDELAEKMNVSPQAVSKWENDLSMPDINILVRLADLFGVSLDMMLREDYTEPRYSQTESPKNKKSINKMSIYVDVYEPEGDNVNLKFPLALAKGKMLKKIMDKYVSEDMDIDIDRLIEMIEDGSLDQIVNVTEADGTTVKIYIA